MILILETLLVSVPKVFVLIFVLTIFQIIQIIISKKVFKTSNISSPSRGYYIFNMDHLDINDYRGTYNKKNCCLSRY